MQLFDETVREMKATAKKLLPHSFPLVTREKEAEISHLKQKVVKLDGYLLGVYYNECKYYKHTLNSLQVFGKKFNYIPFNLAIKVAVRFLGTHKLSLIEVPYQTEKCSKKIFVWTVYYDVDGLAVDNPFHSVQKLESFNGVEFNRLNPSDVKFF